MRRHDHFSSMKQHLKIPALFAVLLLGLSSCIWYGPHGGYGRPYGGGYGGGYYAHPAPPPPGAGGGWHPGY